MTGFVSPGTQFIFYRLELNKLYGMTNVKIEFQEIFLSNRTTEVNSIAYKVLLNVKFTSVNQNLGFFRNKNNFKNN